MAAEKVMLKPGQNPLEMDFTEPRPNLLKLFAWGALIFVCSIAVCIVPVVWALGGIK